MSKLLYIHNSLQFEYTSAHFLYTSSISLYTPHEILAIFKHDVEKNGVCVVWGVVCVGGGGGVGSVWVCVVWGVGSVCVCVCVYAAKGVVETRRMWFATEDVPKVTRTG